MFESVGTALDRPSGCFVDECNRLGGVFEKPRPLKLRLEKSTQTRAVVVQGTWYLLLSVVGPGMSK